MVWQRTYFFLQQNLAWAFSTNYARAWGKKLLAVAACSALCTFIFRWSPCRLLKVTAYFLFWMRVDWLTVFCFLWARVLWPQVFLSVPSKCRVQSPNSFFYLGKSFHQLFVYSFYTVVLFPKAYIYTKLIPFCTCVLKMLFPHTVVHVNYFVYTHAVQFASCAPCVLPMDSCHLHHRHHHRCCFLSWSTLRWLYSIPVINVDCWLCAGDGDHSLKCLLVSGVVIWSGRNWNVGLPVVIGVVIWLQRNWSVGLPLVSGVVIWLQRNWSVSILFSGVVIWLQRNRSVGLLLVGGVVIWLQRNWSVGLLLVGGVVIWWQRNWSA